MTKRKKDTSEELVRVDGEIKKQKNRYYAKVADRYTTMGVIVLLFLAIFGGALMLKYGEYITYDNFVYLIRDFNNVTEQGSDYLEISYDAQDSMVFESFRDGLGIVGNNRITLFDRSGSVLFSDPVSLSYPAVDSGEKYMLVYDIGGSTYSIYNSITRVMKCSTDKPIVSASVSDNGAYIVTTEGKEAKYITRVYNSALKLKMSVRKDKYVTDSAISRDGEAFVIISVLEEGARFMGEVSFYKVGEDKETAAFTYTTSLPISVVSLHGGTYAVLFDDSVRFYDTGGSLKNEMILNDEKVSYFDASDDGILLVCEANTIGTVSRVCTFDSNGGVCIDTHVRERIYGACVSYGKDDIGAYLISTDSIISLGTDNSLNKYPFKGKILDVVDTSSGPLCLSADRGYKFMSAQTDNAPEETESKTESKTGSETGSETEGESTAESTRE